jgi:predicted nucleotidyltransferase
MEIPKLQKNGELPAGEHLSTVDEIEKIYGSSSARRKQLMLGLKEAFANLEKAGVKTIWINGSFVTDKKEPSDIDGCWEYHDGVDLEILDSVFVSDKGTKEMKNKYGLDFFVSNWIEMASGLPFPRFFQVNREGDAKGIIVLKLGASK